MSSPPPQFDIPNEMRAVAERSVEQAKLAFQQLMQAAEESVSTLEERVTASQVGALDISKKAMTFAERNFYRPSNLPKKSLLRDSLGTRSVCPERDDDRRIISGIVHVLQCGARWRDCPPEYGPYTTIYNRFNR